MQIIHSAVCGTVLFCMGAINVSAQPVPAADATSITVASYYFPNYHPGDARNSRLLGKGPGWSEWELVKAARPRYPGHQQPKVPEWGYGNEADPKVMAWKLDAAADHGIDAFIFDWYHYNDGPFLNKALDEGYMLAPNRERVKFALMWANHDWLELHPHTRGTTQTVLFPGKVTPESFDKICDHVIRDYFAQPTYWRIEGRPYFSFYDLEKLIQSFSSLEECRAALDRFREKAREAGLPGLHLNAVVWGRPILPGESTPTNIEKVVHDLGFDSATSYVWIHHVPLPDPQTDYNQVRDGYFKYWEKAKSDFDVPYFPNVTMGWDSTPRTNQDDEWGNWGYPFTNNISGNTPERFRVALQMTKDKLLSDTTGPRIMNINCWNEWTEGSYLEPDTVNGMAYLEAVKDVLGDKDDPLRNPSVIGGLQISTSGTQVTVSPGSAIVAGTTVSVVSPTVCEVKPANIVSVHDEETTLPAELPPMWRGGNLRQVRTANAIPGSFIPDSLKVRLKDRTALQRDKDYLVEETWASIGRTPDSRATTDAIVLTDYRYSLMRLDGIDVTTEGKVMLVEGTPHLVCPPPPSTTTGALRLANVFRPYHSRSVEPWHVFPVIKPFPEPGKAEKIRMSQPVRRTLEKLRRGEPVKIVTWGDSVTVGGDASRPGLAFSRHIISRLRIRFPEAQITHINAGIGGTNTTQRLPNLQAEVLAHKPDLVTIEFVNDMSLPLSELEKNWNSALSQIKAANAEAVVITPHFTSSFIAIGPYPRGPETRPHVGLLREIAAKNGVALADTSRRWEHLELEGIPYITLLYNGINHPNDYGHRLFVRDLLNLFPKVD